MKKSLRALLALTLSLVTIFATLSLSACSGKGPNKLYVGMECGYAPFNYTQLNDADGAVKISNAQGYANGYDVMIAKKIAEACGKELVIRKYEFNALIPAVQSGTLDFIIAGMSPTAERLESIDFSDAYYESQLVIVVRKDGAYANKTTLADFNGAKIVAQVGTFHDSALNAHASNGDTTISEPIKNYGLIRQTPMKDFPKMINALNSKAIDGYVAEEPGAIADCASNPDFTYIKLVNNETGFTASAEDVQIAVGFKKGSELKDSVNAALKNILAADRDTLMKNAISIATKVGA